MDYGQQIKRKRRRCSIGPSVQQKEVPALDTDTIAESPVAVLVDSGPLPGPHSSTPPLDPSSSVQTTHKRKAEIANSSTEQEIDELLFSTSILEECNAIEDYESVERSKCVSEVTRGHTDEVICSKDDVLDEKVRGDGRLLEDEEAGDTEHLFGLYPEDFSFILNSSAVEESHSWPKTCVRNSESFPPVSGNIGTSIPQLPTTCAVVPQTHLPVATTQSHDSSLLTKSVCPSYCPPMSSPNITPASTFINKSSRIEYPTSTFYGLPLAVQSCFRECRGIKKLYDWQDDCLRLSSVHNGSNLIYFLPTSGGKTLVAEVIIFRQLLISKRDVLFILPFVSIVQEKVELSQFASTLEFAVEEYAANKGTIPPRKRRKKKVVYIATIEKANSLTNSLIEQQRISDLGLVVIDELHMLGDGTMRGATLEACIAKVKLCAGSSVQLVGMSATLSNTSQLADFMSAQVFSSNFRPVELVEYVKLGQHLYRVTGTAGDVDLQPVCQIPAPPPHVSHLDPDRLCSLVLEVLPHGSCLVFCPTKKNCQNVALLLSKCLRGSVRSSDQVSSRRVLLDLLSIEAAGVCPTLEQTVPMGVAYHHSGLTADERKVIEEGYLNGTLLVLACTSTLAAGVNLPAKRVILRSPFIGKQLLSRNQYKQMVGRAGRSGLCKSGESILITQEANKTQVRDLLSAPYDKCNSSLLANDSAVFLSLILTLIGLKLVQTFGQLWFFVSRTLLCVQLSDDDYLKDRCHEAVAQLAALGYITLESGRHPDISTYSITMLGQATYRGCLPVKQAHLVHQDLVKGHRCLVLSTDLHLLYLATPLDVGSTAIQPDWMVYFEMLTGLGPDELKVAELVGVEPAILSRKATGTAGKMDEATSSLYLRFYLSLMLHCILKLNGADTIWRVAHMFHCSRGNVQGLLNSASSFAACLLHFTQEIPELWSLTLLLPAIVKKLSYSSSLDLVPLMEISGIKQGRARQLVSAGVTSPQLLAAADPHMLTQNIQHLYFKQAKWLIKSAKAFLSDQADALLEEAEELMSLLPVAVK